MIHGTVSNDNPYVNILIKWGPAVLNVTVLIDTGFEGDLRISPKVAKELGLVETHTQKIRFGNNVSHTVPTSLVYSEMEGVMASLEVIILPGEPYIGVGFLKKLLYGMQFHPVRKELFMKR